MRVVNSHKRVINQPIDTVSELFNTLTTPEDKIWPSNNWPAIRFKKGLEVGNKGGHGLIKYTVVAFEAGHHVKFKFTKPRGFNGTHEITLKPVSQHVSEIQHHIKMNTDFRASLLWIFVIRWLHDALIEEAFDNMEDYYSSVRRQPTYHPWVNLLRKYYKRKKIKPILSH